MSEMFNLLETSLNEALEHSKQHGASTMYYLYTETDNSGARIMGDDGGSYIWITPYKTRKEAIAGGKELEDCCRVIKVEVLNKEEYKERATWL